MADNVIDKHHCLRSIVGASLELGCGDRKRHNQFIGIDALNYECVDIVGDAFDVLARVPTGVVESVVSYHFLEHLSDVPRIISEVARVLRPGGAMQAVVPLFSNSYMYSDLTHKTFFGLYSLAYYSNNNKFRRDVPTYSRRIYFDAVDVRLQFKSARPFYGRFALRKLIEVMVNWKNYGKEFYEENLVNFVSCYEVAYVLKRNNLAWEGGD